jgi:hypothetical protein
LHAVPHTLQPAVPINAAFPLAVKEHTKGLGLCNYLHGSQVMCILTWPNNLGRLLSYMQ